MKKKVLTLLLALALTAGLLILPAGAADAVSTFPDITDPTVGEAVEVLRTMGVLGGTDGGHFDPQGILTRAQFAKMAVMVMGKGADAAVYETQTIFVDVPSTHWARGFVNLAVNTEVGGTRLLQGVGNGCFNPDKPITYDEAVTVLLRMLGYGQQIFANWPFSARNLSTSLKLDENLDAYSGNGGAITRAQAAILFRNLLMTPTAEGAGVYAGSLGSVREDVILTAVGSRAPDGGEGVTLSDSSAPVRAAASLPAAFMVGKRGTAVMDGKGRFLTFIPDSEGLSREVTVQSVTAAGITGTDGVELSVPSSAKVLRDGKESVFGEVFVSLNRPGLTLKVFYTAAGSVDYIFVRDMGSASGDALIAEKDGVGAFDALTGRSRTCRVIKNGTEMTQNELRKFDVGIFDASANILYVTDFRLSALFEDASPNPYAPTSVTLFGRSFDVLPSALSDFENVKIGEVVVFLFSPDGRIAGVRSRDEVRSNAIGLVRVDSTNSAVNVELLNAPFTSSDGSASVVLTAAHSDSVSRHLGQLVNVSGGTRNQNGKNVSVFYLTAISSNTTGKFSVSARTVGNASLADNVAIFEKVGNSAMAPISLADIPLDTVPASKVAFVHRDLADKVDILVLDDVTGDRYTYGFWSTSQVTTDHFDGEEIKNTLTTVTSGDGRTLEVIGGNTFDTKLGGVVASLDTLGGYPVGAGFAPLTEISGATQESFDLSTSTFISGALALPIADAVVCYNEATGTWFESLEKALVYSNSFTVYYDRTPATGGKVRVVVVH